MLHTRIKNQKLWPLLLMMGLLCANAWASDDVNYEFGEPEPSESDGEIYDSGEPEPNESVAEIYEFGEPEPYESVGGMICTSPESDYKYELWQEESSKSVTVRNGAGEIIRESRIGVASRNMIRISDKNDAEKPAHLEAIVADPWEEKPIPESGNYPIIFPTFSSFGGGTHSVNVKLKDQEDYAFSANFMIRGAKSGGYLYINAPSDSDLAAYNTVNIFNSFACADIN